MRKKDASVDEGCLRTDCDCAAGSWIFTAAWIRIKQCDDGHCTQFCLAYPEIFGTDNIIPQTKEAMDAMQALFAELCDMFPNSEYVHVGGDEAAIEKWTTNEECRAYAESCGIDFDTEDKSLLTEDAFKDWMRVCWNLVSGEDQHGRSQIRNTEAMRKAFEFIDSLDPHAVYKSLDGKTVSGNSEFDERCKEEIEKAKKILEGNGWKEKICEAENYAFFKGSIRFLYRNIDIEDWDKDSFDKKYENAKKYFEKYGKINY